MGLNVILKDGVRMKKECNSSIINRNVNLAPIVLFVYKRLSYLKETIESLQKNLYAEQSDLYIYSDASKNTETTECVENVRTYLKTIQGFRSVCIIERKENLGLATNIVDGITEIIKQYGKIIVLEDDIVVSPYFLKYMNDALNLYKDEKKIMEISGYIYNIEKENLPETFFLHLGECWGWGTWEDRWLTYEKNPQKLIGKYNVNDISRFNYYGGFNFWDQIIENYRGKLNTWAAFWHASIIENKGLVLYPRKSLTKHIGFDLSGMHCKKKISWVCTELMQYPVVEFSKSLEENPLARDRMICFFKRISQINKFLQFSRKNKLIFCYGAGEYGKIIALYCIFMEINLVAFLISDNEVKNNRSDYLGIPIYKLSEVEISNINTGIVLGLSDIHHDDIISKLNERGVKKFFRGGYQLTLPIKQFFYELSEDEIKRKSEIIQGEILKLKGK